MGPPVERPAKRAPATGIEDLEAASHLYDSDSSSASARASESEGDSSESHSEDPKSKEKHEVDKLTGRRIRNGLVMYRVRWKSGEVAWEPRKSLVLDVPGMARDVEKRLRVRGRTGSSK